MSFSSGSYPLISNGNATGQATVWPGGEGIFSVYAGAFGGSTVALEWSPDDGATWLPVDADGDSFVSLTEAGGGRFTLPPCQIRAAIAGGSPSGLHAVAKAVNG